MKAPLLMVADSFREAPTNGLELRLWAMVRAFAAEGWDVQVLAFGETANVRKFKLSGIAGDLCVEFVKAERAEAGMWRRLAAVFSAAPYSAVCSRSTTLRERVIEWSERHPDGVVLCEETAQLINFPERLAVPLIIDNHNAEFVLLRRYMSYERNPVKLAYAYQEYLKRLRWETLACKRADKALVCSEVDAATFRKVCPGASIAVAPNVIDVENYRPQGRAIPNTVLYAGGMDWYPNRDAVQYFARRVLPELHALVPGVRFVVAGRSPTSAFRESLLDVPGLEFTGTVLDMRAEIAKAVVCVVPLRIGSGTRLKILEAGAMGKPIVSTGVGAEGLEFADGDEVVLADDPHAFARATARFLGDADLCARFGAAARRRVEMSYSLTALREALNRAVPGNVCIS